MDRAIVFGQHDHLVGVVTEPNERTIGSLKRCAEIAAIMLTPGMLHHVGPFRMHVDLARWLAGHDLRSLRFDLSGIGESLGMGATGCSIDRAAAETSAAMDWMSEHYGCQRFILFGLCSGADDSIHTAFQDPRVAALVVIDGCGFRTRRYHWHRCYSHYLPRLCRPSKWKRLLRRLLVSQTTPPPTLQAGTDVREFPIRDEAAKQLQQLANRGTRMHFVYTGGVAEYYNYAGQFFDMFPQVQWQGHVSTEYFAHMDHVALLCEDREQLIDHVGQRMLDFADEIAPPQEMMAPTAMFPSASFPSTNACIGDVSTTPTF